MHKPHLCLLVLRLSKHRPSTSQPRRLLLRPALQQYRYPQLYQQRRRAVYHPGVVNNLKPQTTTQFITGGTVNTTFPQQHTTPGDKNPKPNISSPGGCYTLLFYSRINSTRTYEGIRTVLYIPALLLCCSYSEYIRTSSKQFLPVQFLVPMFESCVEYDIDRHALPSLPAQHHWQCIPGESYYHIRTTNLEDK